MYDTDITITVDDPVHGEMEMSARKAPNGYVLRGPNDQGQPVAMYVSEAFIEGLIEEYA